MKDDPRITLEDLLAHSGWARGLAVALLGGQGEADDLVQDTWIAALSHPPAAFGSPRPWLARVMRNLAHNRWRKEARRSRRELEAARPEASPGSDELAHELEMHRALAEALAQLDEPLRRTVVRRYFHGLSSAEIARSEGVPESTVRNRLKRALDALRARLDRAYGEREAWCALLAPLAVPHGVPAGLTSAITAASAWKILAAVGVAGAALLWTLEVGWRQHEDRAPLVSTAPIAGLSTSDEGQVVPPPAAATRVSAASSTVAEAPALASGTSEEAAAILEARAVDPDGAPIAGAEIAVADRSELGEIERSAAPRATSDASGRMRLEVRRSDRSSHRSRSAAQPEDEWTLQLEIGAPGREARWEHAKMKAGETTFLGDIALGLGGAIRGRVVMPAGADLPERPWVDVVHPDLVPGEREPVAGKRVAWARLAGDGTYAVAGVPIGTYRIATGSEWPGLIGGCTTPFEVGAGQTADAPDLLLEVNPNVIRGTVVRPDGSAAKNREVEYAVSSGRVPDPEGWVGTTTEADGRFIIAMQSPAICDLYVRDLGEALGEVVARGIPTGTRDLVLQLPEPSWIDLLVLDEKGAPIPAFTVATRYEKTGSFFSSMGGPRPKGRTRVLARALPFFIDVSAEGRFMRELGPFDADRHPDDLTVVLPPLSLLRGRVLCDGRPVAGAEVRMVRPTLRDGLYACNGFPCHFDLDCEAMHAKTAEDGSFSITQRERGTYALWVCTEGFAEAETAPFEHVPDATLPAFEITIGRGGLLEGRVIAAPGRSVEGTLVGISRGDGLCRVMRVGRDGSYRFEHLASGNWTIRRCERDFQSDGEWTYQQVSGFDPSLAGFRIQEGRTTAFDLDLRDAECSVEGRLPPGPCAGSRWVARLQRPGDENSWESSVQVGASGELRIDAGVLGPHLLVLTSTGEAGCDQRVEDRLDLHRGVNPWELPFSTGVLEGESIPGAVLSHAWADARGRVCTTRFVADGEGRFRVVGIPAGAGSVERIQPGGGAPRADVDVPEHGVLRVVLP
jgi:RNA polymerase sigma factor (sigma-70 family)